MIQNKIVVRYQDGKILKGHTSDFLPAKPTFHISVPGASSGSQSQEVKVSELKAIFFVRDFKGDHEYEDAKDFSANKPAGRRIQVIFKDGETLVGATQGYDPQRQGFFVIPADAKSNNERSFIVASATKKISFI